MADEKKEWISALADDEVLELDLDKALNMLRSDSELQSSWSRYHLIRDTLHSNLEERLDVTLHQRISAALEQEPVVLAPAPRSPQPVKRPWIKQAAGIAVAASVTGVAVLAVQQMNQTESAPMATMAEVMQPDNVVRIDTTTLAASTSTNTGSNQKEQENSNLAPYLVNHNEYSVSSGMHGMLPYVRVVGYGEGR